MKVAWLSVQLALVVASAASSGTNRTTNRYDAAEVLTQIFRPNVTLESRQREYGLVRFEDQGDTDNQHPGQYGLLDTGRDQTPLRFEDDYQNYNTDFDLNKPVKFDDSDDYLSSNSNGVTFQDDNNVNDDGNKKKRKRKRRRKPKNGVLPYLGRPDIDVRPGAGYQGPPPAGYGGYEHGAPAPAYTGVRPYRRPRRPRPRPSLATEALSSITGALTSIAQYDDLQCVPRLLCEAAGGGSLPGSGVLQSIAGIQPLLTLLSAYNTVSSSPLFVFGRAVFLGMTSPGSPAPCRYAYPACPTDPEQLIHYLNNHNGGFFRFFNAPQPANQNLEQFYNQLGSQGYGLYQPQQNQYGYPNDQNSGQHYGLYSNNQNPAQYYGQNDGSHRPRPYERPSLYDNQNYGSNYAYDYNNYGSGNQITFRDGDVRIQKRIQNKPSQNFAEYNANNFENDDIKTKWQFPEDPFQNSNIYNVRDIRTLMFPDEGQSNRDEKEFTRQGKQVYFSNQKYHQNYYDNQQHVISNSNRFQSSTYSYNNGQNEQNDYTARPTTYSNNKYREPPKYHNYNYNPSNYNENYNQNYQNPSATINANQYQQNYYNNRQNMYGNSQKYQPTTVFNNEEYVFDHKHNFYVKKQNNYSSGGSTYNTNNYSNNGNNNYYNANNNFKRNEEVGVKTVYVVRGRGDPNHPEIVKLRPGQSVSVR